MPPIRGWITQYLESKLEDIEWKKKDLKVVHPIKDWITQYLETKLEDIEWKENYDLKR